METVQRLIWLFHNYAFHTPQNNYSNFNIKNNYSISTQNCVELQLYASLIISVIFPVPHSNLDYLSSQCQRGVKSSTWCQPYWELHSDSARRSKSSCRCLQDDRLWWHESTGHTGNACRLWNVCGERSQTFDTDNEKRGSQEWIKWERKGVVEKKKVLSFLRSCAHFIKFPRQYKNISYFYIS